MARVTITLHEAQVNEMELKPGTMTVGRLEDNDICLQDDAVSGHHAKIVTFFKASFIQDLGSTNGTYVNGRRAQLHTLRHGDVVALGQHHITYIGQAAAPTEPTPRAAMTQVISREALDRSLGAVPGPAPAAGRPAAPAAPGPSASRPAPGEVPAGKAYIMILAGPSGRRHIPLSERRIDLGHGVLVTESAAGHVVNRDRRGATGDAAVRLNGRELGYEPVVLKNKDTLQLGGDLMAYFAA